MRKGGQAERAGRPGRRGRAAVLGLATVGLGALAYVIWSSAKSRAVAPGLPGGTEFSGFIDDLPIMPGLAEAGDGYAFELFQGGRLAEARLVGEVEPSVVRGFYSATLAQLGWRVSETEPYVYHRGPERLIFLVEPRRKSPARRAQKGLELVFVITPEARAPAARRGRAESSGH